MPAKVHSEFNRIQPKAEKPFTSLGPWLEHQMKTVHSNNFLKAEKQAGNWEAGQESLTFGQAYQQAVGFALSMANLGIGPGSRVGVWCTNGIEYSLAILGCHLCGAAAIIREPDMPLGELVAVARATRPHLVLLSPGSSSNFKEFAARMSSLPKGEARKVTPWFNADISALDDPSAMLLMRVGAPGGGGDFPGRGVRLPVDAIHVASYTPPELPPDTVAVICMTSGTTGTPKGVMHTTGGLVWAAQNIVDDMWYNHATLGPRAPHTRAQPATPPPPSPSALLTLTQVCTATHAPAPPHSRASPGAGSPGDNLPTLITFQSGYISAYLVVLCAATVHLQVTFADTPELQTWLATQAWPHDASPVIQMLLPAVLTRIWKKAAPKIAGKAAGRFLYGKLAAARKGLLHADGAVPRPESSEKLPTLAKLADKKVAGKVRLALGGRCKIIVTAGAKPDIDLLRFFWTCGIRVLEGFISTEILFATVNTTLSPGTYLGTAGAPPAGVDVKLSSAGEICVKSPMGTTGYFDQPEITAASFDADGYFKTGDKGEWRTGNNGAKFLAITGRIKDMIILDQRENVWPETLEGIFKRSPLVADCCIPMSCEGPGRKHLLLLFATASDDVTDEQIRAEVRAHGAVAGIQAHEYPMLFVRVAEAFSKENGFRNANHKLMRKKIDEHYKASIDAAFSVDPVKAEKGHVALKDVAQPCQQFAPCEQPNIMNQFNPNVALAA